jgi:hypothetical protein
MATPAVENRWPTLSAQFSDIMSHKPGLSEIRNHLTQRAAQAKLAQEEANAQKVRGPVTLVLAGLRSMSRTLAVPLTALEPSAAITATGLGWTAKFIHTMVLLVFMALIYVTYTQFIFTQVTEENTFMITSTLTWLVCLLIILWMA